MKKFIRMKRRFSLCCVAFMAIALICIPMSVKAEEIVLTYPIYHKHIASCETIVNKTMSANGASALRTVRTDTCACGGHHDYYEFNASCSCGKTWHTTGHACVNSPAGSYQGSCTNYSRINCNTSHLHPVKDYICGQTENTIIDTVTIFFSTLQPVWEVEMSAKSDGMLNDVGLAWEGTEGNAQMSVSANGEYHLYATYKEQDIEYVSDIVVAVNNIDWEAPFVSEIKSDKEDFTADNIILSLEASDSGGLPENYVSWNGNEFGSSNCFEIEENGTYEAVVKDIAGNEVVRTIKIENIDKMPPKITELTTDPKPWYSRECKVTVLAIDQGNGNDGSGLPENAYSWNEGNTWTSQNWVSLSEEGIVTLWIKDNVGNVLQKDIEMRHQKRPSDNNNDNNQVEETTSEQMEEETETPSSEESIKVEEESEETIIEESPEEELIYTFLPEPNWDNDVIEIQVEEETVYAEKENNEMKVLENAELSFDWMWILCLTIVGVVFLSMLLFFAYVYMWMCRIYEVDNRQRERHIGTTGIRFKKTGYSVKIGESIIHKANSRILKAKLPKWFVKFAEYKPFRIMVGESVIDKYVEREVDFHISS